MKKAVAKKTEKKAGEKIESKKEMIKEYGFKAAMGKMAKKKK
jgi:hypothetical protein